MKFNPEKCHPKIARIDVSTFEKAMKALDDNSLPDILKQQLQAKIRYYEKVRERNRGVNN